MRYLTASEVILVNEQEVGPDLLSDFGLLEAAVLRPQQSVFGSDAYPDIDKGCRDDALAHPQPCIYRRQQTHRGAGDNSLLQPQWLRVNAAQEDLIALALDVAEGQIDVQGIAGILKSWARPLPLPEE